MVSKHTQQSIQEDRENILLKKYNAVFKLTNRRIVSVTGPDAESFLQSMMTNDMKLLKDNRAALFTLFLNPKGRILYDTILVKSHLYFIYKKLVLIRYTLIIGSMLMK